MNSHEVGVCAALPSDGAFFATLALSQRSKIKDVANVPIDVMPADGMGSICRRGCSKS